VRGRTHRRLAVLGFHKIGDPPGGEDSWFYVSATAFTNCLEWLEVHGWQVISAFEFLEGLARPEKLPAKSVLLTFDDGYLSMCRVAVPLLTRFHAPAVLFVPTAFVGGTNAFDAGIEPEEVMCGWEDLRALHESMVSVQSHGTTHTGWSSLDECGRDRDLADSKAELERGVGHTVDMFSFPYGDCGDSPTRAAAALRRAGYRAAFLFRGGAVSLPVAHPYAIERIPIGPDSKLDQLLGESA
jgi:peptidoglycan/xylan/chitin deacetylase (PgdA/CDA1 family)